MQQEEEEEVVNIPFRFELLVSAVLFFFFLSDPFLINSFLAVVVVVVVVSGVVSGVAVEVVSDERLCVSSAIWRPEVWQSFAVGGGDLGSSNIIGDLVSDCRPLTPILDWTCSPGTPELAGCFRLKSWYTSPRSCSNEVICEMCGV